MPKPGEQRKGRRKGSRNRCYFYRTQHVWVMKVGNQTNQLFVRLCRKVGVKITPHGLRHGHACHFYAVSGSGMSGADSIPNEPRELVPQQSNRIHRQYRCQRSELRSQPSKARSRQIENGSSRYRQLICRRYRPSACHPITRDTSIADPITEATMG